MKRPIDRHLDGDEIDALVNVQMRDVSRPEQSPVEAIREAQTHVESCPDCQQKVELHRSVQREFSRLHRHSEAPAGPECPGEEELLRLAAGLLPESQARKLMKHAAHCDHCGPSLKAAVAALSDEATADEENLMASLPSAGTEWQSRLADTLRRTRGQQEERAVPWWRGLLAGPRLAFAAGALVTLVVVGWAGFRVLRPATPEQLLARAYSEHRTLEVRIPGASYAPMRVERGGRSSNLEKPASLLHAEALIGENLQKTPNDPRWLEAKARADLLDGNYDSGIKTLQRAMETDPDSPQLLSDLGSAYYMRAKSADRAIDYGNAIESLGKALAKTPNDPIALFNHALACEEMFLYTQAAEDWERYLRVDPSSEWADEARQHLDALQQKVKQHAIQQMEPLLNPTEILQSANASGNGWPVIDSRAEDYMDQAIKEWLPQAFSLQGRESGDVYAALHWLANDLASHHQDRWLVDLLAGPVSSAFAEGLNSLSMAVRADEKGDPDSALRQAGSAERWFERAGSNAGLVRARVERIYALHRKYQLHECMAQIGRTQSLPSIRNYPWIATQLNLEKYACSDSTPASTKQNLAAARSLAQQASYGTLFLRALAFSASNETDAGDSGRAWAWDRVGLERYWSGNYRPLRAQHFYDDMAIAAHDSSQWVLAVAIESEAVAAIVATPNRSGEGMERIELARSATMAHLWQEAEEQYSLAVAAFATLSQNESSRAFRATAEIGLAVVALNQQNPQRAEVHLRYAQQNLPPTFDSPETWILFYQATAEFKRQSGDLNGARRECEASVMVSEAKLKAVSTELDRLRWNQEASQCYKALIEAKLDERDEAGALELWEWYRSAGVRPHFDLGRDRKSLANLDQTLSLPAADEVRSSLASLAGETVVVYAELMGQVNAWVYDDRGVYWERLAVPALALGRDAATFMAQCSDPQSDPSLLGRRLYDVLVQPLIAHLDPSRTLVFEVDDGISAVPFAALIEPDGNYLVDRFRVAYLPSLGFRHLLRPSDTVSTLDEALVVSSPAISPRDQQYYLPLPDAEKEADYVAALLPNSVILRGKGATRSAVIHGLRDARVFHFAGHTRLQPGHNGLLLAAESEAVAAESTIFRADEFQPDSVPNLRLAVLSACSTDQGRSSGDDLARAFLRTGVPNVVATRWSIDSAATADLMRHFYKHLLAGESVPLALQEAMRQVRSSPQYRHPYFWAGVEAFGRAS